jgi:DNA-binding transcriptional MerR regulator
LWGLHGWQPFQRRDEVLAITAPWLTPLEREEGSLARPFPGDLDLERTPTSTVSSMRIEPEGIDDQERLTIAEVVGRTGLSTDTLRYYERVGLIAPVGRTAGNHRAYAASDLDWLDFLLRLRETGMTINDMHKFAELRSDGDSSVPARLDMLRRHRASLDAHISSLCRNAEALDDKIDHYQQLVTEQQKREHS